MKKKVSQAFSNLGRNHLTEFQRLVNLIYAVSFQHWLGNIIDGFILILSGRSGWDGERGFQPAMTAASPPVRRIIVRILVIVIVVDTRSLVAATLDRVIDGRSSLPEGLSGITLIIRTSKYFCARH